MLTLPLMSKFFRILFSLYGLFIFIFLMFILFPFIVIASFFGRVRGGGIVYKICVFWADTAFLLWGIRHKNFYEGNRKPEKARIYIFNHISYMDIPIILKTFRHQPIRVLAKASMAKIPIFGFIYKTCGVLVDRRSPEARAKSLREMKFFLSRKISIVIAPEGTFNMTTEPLKDFYNGAFKIAIETGTDIQPVLFLDGYDRLGYETVFSLTPGRSRSVILPVISSAGYTEENMDELKQKAYDSMEEALIRYEASWIK